MTPRHCRPTLTRLTLPLAALCLAVMPAVVQAQGQPRIKKEDIVAALQKGRARPSEVNLTTLTKHVRDFGVDFMVTAADEQRIRQAGDYLAARLLDDLIVAVRGNYRLKDGTAAAGAAGGGDRIRVSLFNYAPCSQYQEQFANMLKSQVTALAGKFSAQDESLEGLQLVEEGQPFNMSLREANDYWETTRSLQILKGTCDGEGKNFSVISQVFLGNLHGPLENPILVEYRNNVREYGRMRDIHSLLILYSLARDAQQRGLKKGLIINYLRYAYVIASDCNVRNDPSVESIRKAVTDMLRELGSQADTAESACPADPARPNP